jgi:hypothetical protein
VERRWRAGGLQRVGMPGKVMTATDGSAPTRGFLPSLCRASPLALPQGSRGRAGSPIEEGLTRRRGGRNGRSRRAAGARSLGWRARLVAARAQKGIYTMHVGLLAWLLACVHVCSPVAGSRRFTAHCCSRAAFRRRPLPRLPRRPQLLNASSALLHRDHRPHDSSPPALLAPASFFRPRDTRPNSLPAGLPRVLLSPGPRPPSSVFAVLPSTTAAASALRTRAPTHAHTHAPAVL